MGPGLGTGDGGSGQRLSGELDAILTLRRLCREYHAVPSVILAEDGTLLLQLLEVDAIIDEERVKAQEPVHPSMHMPIPESTDAEWEA